ncbi:MAG: MBL fold metallo-hydrolase, partial [Nanohaloarchaea archaeon]|nr:MBL fold metallo-hydrolase [Candidatus Nanohaloarchaea archaeon]
DIHLIQLGGLESNIYLIKKKVLIDAGLGFHKKILEKALTSLNITPDDIERVIFTHAHYDHVGGASSFKKAKIAIHTDDAEIMETGDNNKSCAFAFGKKLTKTKIDLKLIDSDIIRIDDIALKVIHTPGHTDGSICLYDKNKKILFTGDTIFLNAIGRTDLPGSDGKKMAESLHRLKDIHITTILPGHGKIIETDAENMINKTIDTYS